MASDGTVTIKVKADDGDLKKLQRSIDELMNKLKELSSGNPFKGVMDGARQAVNSVSDLTQGFGNLTNEAQEADGAMSVATGSASELGSNVSDINGEGLYDVSAAANVAESDLGLTGQAAVNLARDVSDVDGEGLYDVSMAADLASADLDSAGFAANNLAQDVAGIDGEGLYDVSSAADVASVDLDSAGFAANNLAQDMSDIDGEGLYDVSMAAGEADKAIDEVGESAQKAGDQSKTFSQSLLDILKSVGGLELVRRGFDMIVGSIGDAVDRFDTFNTFPKVMSELGYSTDEVDRSMRRLDEGIQGLPTKLDDVVRHTQRIAAITGDLDEATETTLALNNAFLANSASTADAKRGTEQYIQMLSSGRVDMQSWKTLQETMPIALERTAEAFGYTGNAAQTEFYQALRDGKITFDEFNSKLIELSEAQGGFADLAQTNSRTLRVSWENVKTAIARGVADVIQSLDDLSKKITGNSIAENFDHLKDVVDVAFQGIVSAIEAVSPVVEGLSVVFKGLIEVVKFMSPAIMGAVVAFTALKIVSELKTWFLALKGSVMVAQLAFTQMATGATLASTALGQAGTASKVFGTIMAVLTGKVQLATVATTVFNGVVTALGGPFSAAIVAIGALIGSIFVLGNAFNKNSEEAQQLKAELEELTEQSSQLVDQVDRSASSHEKAMSSMQAQQQSTQQLASETIALAEAEQLSAGEKETLKANIETLNGSVEGLNLAYNEETESLNMSTEAMRERLSVGEQQETLIALEQRLNEVNTERNEIAEQIKANEEKLAEATETRTRMIEGETITTRELTAEGKALEEQQEALKAKYEELGITAEDVEARKEAAAEKYAETMEKVKERGILSMEDLSDAQRRMVEEMRGAYDDLESVTTNAFDTISQKQALSVEEMNKNLLENQQMVSEWASGLKDLANRGVDKGLIEELRKMGPAGRDQVKALQGVTDTELAVLSENFRSGGETAKEALKDSLNVEGEMIPGLEGLVSNTKQTLSEQLAGSGLVDVVPNELEKAVPKMQEAGQNTAEGAAQGLERGSERVKAVSRQMGEGVDSEFASALGIHSPSTVFIQHGQDVTTGLQQGVEQGKSGVMSVLKGLATEMSQTMQDSMKQMSEVSTSSFTQFVTKIETSFTKATTVVQTQSNQMVSVVQSSMSRLNNLGSSAFNQFVSKVTTAYNRATQVVSSKSNQMQSAITSFYQNVQSRTRSAMDQLVQTTQTSYNRMSQIVRTQTNQQTTTITSATERQQSAVRSGYDAMVSQISSSMSRAVSVTRSAMDSVVAIMRSTAGQTRSAGYNMGVGFRNGLASTSGSIMATARSIANAASSAIRSALRIHSPSRVTQELGVFTGEGLAVGMKDSLRDVEKMADQLAESAIPQIDLNRSLGSVGMYAGGSGAVYNNQSYSFNATAGGSADGMTRDEMIRLFEEFKWYIKQEGGRLNG